jgi:hypothetical protein
MCLLLKQRPVLKSFVNPGCLLTALQISNVNLQDVPRGSARYDFVNKLEFLVAYHKEPLQSIRLPLVCH